MDCNEFRAQFYPGIPAFVTYELDSEGDFLEMYYRDLFKARGLKWFASYTKFRKNYSCGFHVEGTPEYLSLSMEDLRSRLKRENGTTSTQAIVPTVASSKISALPETENGSHKLPKQNRATPRTFAKVDVKFGLENACEGNGRVVDSANCSLRPRFSAVFPNRSVN